MSGDYFGLGVGIGLKLYRIKGGVWGYLCVKTCVGICHSIWLYLDVFDLDTFFTFFHTLIVYFCLFALVLL